MFLIYKFFMKVNLVPSQLAQLANRYGSTAPLLYWLSRRQLSNGALIDKDAAHVDPRV